MSDVDNITAPELEQRARDMGWRPKEEFKGADHKWVDANTFVERGEHVLPIVKASNERLRGELSATNTRLNAALAAIEEGKQTVAALERYHQEDVKQKVENARAKLRTEIASAHKAGDIEGAVELQEELTTLNTNVATAEAAAETAKATNNNKNAQQIDYTKTPEYQSWVAENSWMGTDRAKTAIAEHVSIQLRASGNRDIGRSFLDKVTAGVNAELERLGAPKLSPKVEAGRGGAGGNTGGGNGKGKSYNDLPPAAKEACKSFERDLVGENKRYKTVADWQRAYAEQHFKDV